MTRAAGDSPHYEWLLNGNPELPSIKLPSVTTILQRIYGAHQGVVTWAYNRGKEGLSSPDEYRGERAEQGTAAHDHFERLARGEIAPDLNTDDAYELAINTWWLKAKPIPIAPEQVVFSLRYHYAGTCDLVYAKRNGVGVLDLKTRTKKAQAYDSDKLQVAAYALAYQEMQGGPLACDIVERAVLVVRDDGTHTFSRDPKPERYNQWLQTRALYRTLTDE